MNFIELEQLHAELAAAPPGTAMRLGVAGNTPDDVALRWERWSELADYEQQLRSQARDAGEHASPGIFGLDAVGYAYGDLDRLENGGVLIYAMEAHLETGHGEVSPEVVERVVEDAIADARNPDRTVRVPGRDEASQWWEDEQDVYRNHQEAENGPLDLVEADEAVVLLRRRIVDALVHGQAMAEDPTRRAEAERYIKREIAMAREHVELARRKYTAAARDFHETRDRESTPDSLRELFESNRQVAVSRAAALTAYSVALERAARRTTPFMACLRRSLSERFPHEDREILATKAGRLTEQSSVEAALRLTPTDPVNWYPDQDGMIKRIHRYIDTAQERDRLDWDEMVDRRHLPRTPTLRGQGLAMACYDVISKEQKDLSDRWRKLSSVERSIVDDRGVNSARAHDYSTAIGLPAMPALAMADQAREAGEGLSLQKWMVEKAADPQSMYTVEPPTVEFEQTSTFEMWK